MDERSRRRGAEGAILVVEDEPSIRAFLRATLERHGYDLIEATTGQGGLDALAAGRPDAVILDLGLPDMDGFDVLRRLRERSAVPVIVLSARGQERDKVAALDLGADDYLTKPFGVGELLARIRVALRHAAATGGEPPAVYASGGLRVDLEHRQVSVDGEAVHLTPIEHRLLACLVRHEGRVLTHRQLLRDVWGPGYTEAHLVRVYMGQLRHKLEPQPARPRWLLTEPGVGYRLVASG